MAANGKKEDKVFDIAPAGKRAPLTGSKPVIVGHKLEVNDPMVKSEEPQTEDIRPPSKMAKKIMPVDDSETEPITEEKISVAGLQEEKPAPQEPKVTVEQKSEEPKAEEKQSETQEQKPEEQADQKEKTVDEQEAERQAKVDELVASKQYFVKVSAPSKSLGKKLLLPLVFLMLLAGAYLAVDAELIKTDLKLPYEFFKKSELADDTATTNSALAQQVVAEEASTKKEEEPTQTTESPTITGIDLLLQKVGDEKKLPTGTPPEFVAYMKQKLTDFECETEGSGITVKKVSESFASGLVGCEDGYAAYWYLKDGKWQELGTQDGVECPDLEASKIPSEFIPTCVEDFDAKTQVEKPNPNGSIDS